MKLHRFIGKFDFSGDNEFKIQDAEIARQIKDVLRLRVGESVILCDGKMNDATSEIVEIGKNFIKVKIVEVAKNQSETNFETILYCSVLKRDNFEMVVQKATEVGIKEIVPIVTRRTIKLNLRRDRLEKIAKEAAEQSGRGIIPIIHDPKKFNEAVTLAEKNKINFLFDKCGESMVDRLKISAGDKVGIFIGPEGGWETDEINVAQNNNFEIRSLGLLTLRAETAATVASYLINSM